MTPNPKTSDRRPGLRLGGFAMLCVLLACPCKADTNHLIDVWTPYEGLPQSRVLSIAQTPDGYLWVSTQLGWLARFDGIRFEHYNPNNTPELGSPSIQKLIADDGGTLWICDVDGKLVSRSDGKFNASATGEKPGYNKRVIGWIGRHGGESRFLTASGMLLRAGEGITYENGGGPAGGNPWNIQQFCQQKDGTLWCRTAEGAIGRWIGGAMQPATGEGLPAGTVVKHLLAMPDGGLRLATDDGLWKFSGGQFSRSGPALPQDIRSIDHIARSPDNSLWLLSGNRLTLLRGGEPARTTILPDLGIPKRRGGDGIHVDSEGGAWIIKPGGGVLHVRPDGGVSLLDADNGLPSDLVDSWFEDREGNIWLGTAAGLVRVRPRWFRTVATRLNSGVVSVCEDLAGHMWLGRADGLSRWRNGRVEDVPLGSVREGFPVAEITIAPGGSPGDVWLGTIQSGALLLRGGEITQPFPYPSAGLAIRMIRRDPAGGVWFGGEFGLFRWDGRKLRKFGEEEGLSPGHIHDISFDEEGTPWIAKADDLLVVYRGGRFEKVPLPGVSPNLRIYTVLCGKDGNVWLGTVGAGLIHLSRGKVFRYTRRDGLPADSVSQLLEDDDGFLWGGTLQGIFRVSTTALEMRTKGNWPPFLFQHYDHTDGLPNAECSGGLQPACWKACDGKLWFSTSSSAVVIDPRQVHKNLVPPVVAVEQLLIDGVPSDAPASRAGNAPHRIAPGSHRYEFVFTGLSFTAPEKVRFQWILEGVDRGWIDGGKQRNASYSGLGPGTYRFKVRASNNDGVWSMEPAIVAFTVAPHLWQRASVRIAAAAGGFGFCYLAIAGIMRRKHARELRYLEYERSLEQQRFRHRAAMEAERSRIAAELHDDLGASLTQIQWLGDAARRARSSSSGESELLDRITRKTREMVRTIDEIVWAANPRNDTLDQLVTYVCNFAEQYFRDSPTRCRIDLDSEIPARDLAADVRHHLFLIAKEAFHNVGKHAATDRVWVRVACEAGVFKLLIEDRGKGFDLASATAGNGLANMRRRAKLAGAEATVDSSPGHGTRVTLLLKPAPNKD